MRVYLAAPIGMYQNKHTAAAKGGPSSVHRVLLSYLPQFKTVEPLARALERTKEPIDYCVDSGAHVWISDFFKKNVKKSVIEAEAFIKHFLDSIRALPRKPSFVVELDIQQLFGNDVIAAWRKDIWAPFERETGIRVCYVWHPADELTGWVSMLEDPDMRYIGMGGATFIGDDQRNAMAIAAYRAGKPTHCFAGVNVKWIMSAPFFSVDSTSWAVSAQAFGNAVRFDATTGKLQRFKIGNAQVRKGKDVAALGLLQTGIHASDVIDRGRANNSKNYGRYYEQSAKPYQQLEEWHTARWRAKGVDWERRLEQSGHHIANGPGGHIEAAL